MPNEVQNIIERIIGLINPVKIIMFGSYSNNSQNKDSDLDLLIITDTQEPRYKSASNLRMQLYPYSLPLDLLVYTPTEYEKWKNTKNHILYNIENYGLTVYERQ
ncbi:MAG: nucleotidyltransferase domain-containing protein [Bacteroidota bacterium]|jgi:predicted nucleotidyltransferase